MECCEDWRIEGRGRIEESNSARRRVGEIGRNLWMSGEGALWVRVDKKERILCEWIREEEEGYKKKEEESTEKTKKLAVSE